MGYTLSVFAVDVGGAERTLRRSTISEDALGAYVGAPGAVLGAMPSLGGTQPDGFRITDARGRVRIAYTGARRSRMAG